jgi:hypothetical protein
MKANLNQHVFVYDPFGYQAVECIVRAINGGLYKVEPVEYKNIPTFWYGIDLYETKEQCLKTEYELAEYCIKQETKKKKELKKQLNDIT